MTSRGLTAYLIRLQGIASRHGDLIGRIGKRWQGKALTTALRLNRLAMDVGWETVDDDGKTYRVAHRMIHGGKHAA